MKHLIAMVVLLLGVQRYSVGQYHLQPLTPLVLQPIRSLSLSPVQLFTPVAANSGTSSNCTGSCSIILPLTQLALEGARLNDQQVALQWKTKNETASRGFEVERSLGDAAHFATVAKRPSLTGSAVEKRYTATDTNTYAGTSFYRIRQVDLNGNSAYSNTIAVKGYNIKGAVWVWPNPVGNVARITCFAASSGVATIKLITVQGQTVHQANWALATGSNQLQLPVSMLSPGTYYLQLVWPNEHQSELKLSKE